jgi:hypothetical protein
MRVSAAYNGPLSPEWKGEGNSYDYGFRVHDARLGRFLSVDSLAAEYPWYTPYQFAGNMVIQAIDIDGLEPGILDGNWDPTNPNDPDNPFFLPLLIRTSWFDLKHSIENRVLQAFGTPEGMKYLARYKKDENGNEIFETEIVLVPKESSLKELLNTGVDLVNIASAGKLDPTDFIAVRATSSPQLTRPLLKALADFRKATSKFAVQYKCKEYAKSAMTYLKSLPNQYLKDLGISEIHHRYYQGHKYEVIGDMSNQYAKNGYHEWIEATIDDIEYVFDNMNPKGIKKSDYFGPNGIMGSGKEGIKSGKMINNSGKTIKKSEIK